MGQRRRNGTADRHGERVARATRERVGSRRIAHDEIRDLQRAGAQHVPAD
jgi:hypothetical protein